MKRYFLLFFLCSLVYSQELPKFTPPSPTAYQLGKYGEIPIGLFTGSPNITVPLLEYKTKELTIPITLGYSSNGIKVDELETKVGLGWVINTGGIISRITRNGPDELRGNIQPAVVNEDYRTLDFINYYYTTFDGSQRSDSASSLVFDSEPDIFNFNFLGRTGTFTFNNDRKVVVLSDFSLKVTFNPDGLGGFLIIDEQGIKYYFNTTEESRLDTSGDNGSSHMGVFSTTSWSISKIITPNNDIVNFNYADEFYYYITTQEQSLTIYKNYPITELSSDNCHHQANPPIENPLNSHYLNIKGKRIMSISSTNSLYGTINFEYNILNPQVSNYSMLSTITLKNNLNSIVEKADLNYTSQSQRMFLNEVKFLDPTKKYNFEYEQLSSLPKRLSFAKDYWGYYNNKVTNVRLYPNLSGINKTIENKFNNSFPNGANRNLDETTAKIGLLKKLIYPTRGYSEFEYESNDYSTCENISTMMSTANLQVSTTPQDPLFAEKATTLTLTNLAESYNGPLQISFGINYPVCFNSSSAPSDRKLFIQITDLTNLGNTNIIYLLHSPLSGSTNNITITENDVEMNNYFVKFEKNHSYSIKISMFYQCLKGGLKFDYPINAAQLVCSNKKTGGLRVSKVTNKESSGTFLSSKKYFYSRKDYLSISSGTPSRPMKYFSSSYESGLCAIGPLGVGYWTLTYDNLNSNDLAYKYIPEFQNTRYEYVTVSDDTDQFENGGIEYKYKIKQLQQMSPNAIVFGSFLEAFPENVNSWGDGLNLETTIFKKVLGEFKVIKKEINNYQRDSRINETILGFKIVKKWDIFLNGGPYTPVVKAEIELNVTKYEITTNWNYLSSKTVQLFDVNGLNPIETITSYFYDNPIHCQLTRTTTNNSNGIPTINKTYYADDVVTISSLGLDPLSTETFTAFNKLKTPTVSNPYALHQNGKAIQTDSYSDVNNDGVASSNELLSSQRINYKDWGNNNVLPKSIQTLKGVYNSSTNYLQDRIQFYSYYDDAKVKELSQNEGSHIIYIWGYNKTQPIVKIENFTETQLAAIQTSLIDPAIIASDNDSSIATENTLRTKLNDIRNNTALSGAMVTTYTYDPLIGVTTITDPKGDMITFTYDSFGRLQFVKDKNDNILSENEYHHRP
jgi:YD repeat-containing protein